MIRIKQTSVQALTMPSARGPYTPGAGSASSGESSTPAQSLLKSAHAYIRAVPAVTT